MTAPQAACVALLTFLHLYAAGSQAQPYNSFHSTGFNETNTVISFKAWRLQGLEDDRVQTVCTTTLHGCQAIIIIIMLPNQAMVAGP
jgi:hypothetical protein